MSARGAVIRPGHVDDFDACLAIDHHYQTDRVWQMNYDPGENAHRVRFQAVRLPSPQRVPYPYPMNKMVERWCQANLFLVRTEKEIVQAYITLMIDPMQPIAWINDIVVRPERRRQGLASHLLRLGAHWAGEQKMKRLMAQVQTKNNPAAQFFRKNGLAFCGYNEYLYHDQMIALYFSQPL